MRKLGVLLVFLTILVSFIGCASTIPRPIASTELPTIVSQNKAEKAIIPRQKEIAVVDSIEQPKISNLWEGTDIKDVLKDCAGDSGINIISDDTVQGIISLEIKDVPLEQALKMILSPLGYVFKKIDNYYLVGSGLPGSPSALLLSKSEEIITNRPADEVLALLPSGLIPYVKIVKGGYSLSVNGPEEIIDNIKNVINSLDVPDRLIQIEVLVTEVSKNKEWGSGIDLSKTLNLTASGQGSFVSGAVAAYTGAIGGNLSSSIKMMAQNGGLDLKARPKLVTSNGKSAEINVETGKYVILAESIPQSDKLSYFQRFESKPIISGVNLKVTPRISREGEVILEMETSVSDMSQTDSQELPVVQSRKTKTTVRVKSNETVVIGGLFQKISRNSKKDVPLLNRVPGMGFLFSRKEESDQQTELIIFVTPEILEE